MQMTTFLFTTAATSFRFQFQPQTQWSATCRRDKKEMRPLVFYSDVYDHRILLCFYFIHWSCFIQVGHCSHSGLGVEAIYLSCSFIHFVFCTEIPLRRGEGFENSDPFE
jgi:hypothetical protein